MKKLFLILFLFSGLASSAQFVNNNQRIFNILNFGAKGDGRRAFDAVMTGTTTLTSATAVFTSADVGKVIRVGGAGASSHDIVTTIAGFTNSTTVTLGTTGTITGGRIIYGTDNTTAIQNAIWADSLNTGKIFIPNGVFCVGGALVTSIFGDNPNAQIVFPVANIVTGSTFYKRTHFVIEGETPPNYIPANFIDSITQLTGSVIYSIIDGSGNLPAVFGTKSAVTASSNLNFNYFTFKNLSVVVAQNIGNGGPSMCGINMYYSSSVLTENVLVTADGSIGRSVQPTNEVFGIIGSRQGGEIQTKITNTLVCNFKYGIFISDGAFIDNVEVEICQYALVIGQTKFNVEIGYFKPMWNNNNILVPNATIGGYLQSGAAYFHVNNMASEIFLASGNWYDYSKVIVDVGNNAVADVDYTLFRGGFGTVTNTSYSQTGGTGIRSRALGDINVMLPNTFATLYSFAAKFSDLTGGGGSVFAGLSLQNSSAVSPGGGQYNISPVTSTAGNGAVSLQFTANYGSGATAPFTTQGGVLGTRTNDPLIFFQNSNQIARVDAAGYNPFTTATFDLGTSSLLWRSVLSTGANSHGHVNVSATGTYNALATDYTIEFTGSTATLVYPTLNLVNGRTLNLVNYASGSITIPSTKSGNATTITTLTTGQRAIVEYDLANTTWIVVSIN